MGACFPSSPGSMNKASCFPDTFRITPISTDAFGALAIQAERGGQDPLPIDLVLSREQNEIAPVLSCHTRWLVLFHLHLSPQLQLQCHGASSSWWLIFSCSLCITQGRTQSPKQLSAEKWATLPAEKAKGNRQAAPSNGSASPESNCWGSSQWQEQIQAPHIHLLLYGPATAPRIECLLLSHHPYPQMPLAQTAENEECKWVWRKGGGLSVHTYIGSVSL